MDDHTDSPAPPETRLQRSLRLFGPAICVLLTGLLITALAEHQSETIAWAYGTLISGFAAAVCALVSFRWHRQAGLSAAIQRDLRDQIRQLSNVRTEKQILRQALEDSEQRSRDLVALSGAIICELDEQGKAGYVSAGVTEVLGFEPADLAGVAVDSLISETDRNTYEKTLKTAREQRQLQSTDLDLIDIHQQPVPATLRALVLYDTLHGFSGYRLSIQPRAISD